jgi:ankyrin repeat protein
LIKLILTIAFIAIASVASAQLGPSPEQVAAYEGLHKAAHENNVNEIQRFVAKGANVNVRDPKGRSPTHVAAFASNNEALRALAAAKADMNALEGQAYDVVTIAAVANDLALMSLAIRLGNDPGLTTSPYKGTALIAAAHLGHFEVVRRLIAAGAPLDHVNNLGWTALLEAVILGDGGVAHQKIVRGLLDAGADRTITDRDGVSPLQHARSRDYEIIAALLSNAD